jgi:hypothetical protein
MALQNVVTGTLVRAELALIGTSIPEMGRRLLAAIVRRVRDVFNDGFEDLFDSYRPELHYMRGPGPRWREKHGLPARNTRG